MGAMRTSIFLLAQQAKQAFANKVRNKAHDSIGTESQQRKAGGQKTPADAQPSAATCASRYYLKGEMGPISATLVDKHTI